MRVRLLLVLFLACAPAVFAQDATVETLVCLRHGERMEPSAKGQLVAKGLNRSLALPRVLLAKFGKPDYLFAPNPAKTMTAKDGQEYCYVRPLATLEPTAIFCGMPINTLIGYRDIDDLEDEVRKPVYRNAVLFIAWEHVRLEKFVRQLVKDLGGDGAAVPFWKGDDYDSLYIVRITTQNGQTHPAFTLDHEGLDHLSAAFPLPAP